MSGYITNGTTQDGFGARMQRAVNTMAFTFYLRDTYGVDIEYIHTPFAYEGFEKFNKEEVARAVGDNLKPYNEISREGYLKRAVLWDNCMQYSGTTISYFNFTNIKIVNSLDFDKRSLFSDVSNKNINNKLYFVKYLSKELNSGNLDVNIVDKYYSEIRERFKFITPATGNSIIIHIRRKDAIKFGSQRYVDDGYYLGILKALIPFKDKYDITIHTQRKGFDSSKYTNWHVIYDDEEEDYDLFLNMISAKILVVGKSSFSIAAGYFNRNIVIYPSQPTKGLSRWINNVQFLKILANDKVSI